MPKRIQERSRQVNKNLLSKLFSFLSAFSSHEENKAFSIYLQKQNKTKRHLYYMHLQANGFPQYQDCQIIPGTTY
jgi:hypothetical protein